MTLVSIFFILFHIPMSDAITLPATILPSQIETGMTLRIHQIIKDVTSKGEEKERVQIYEGLVIAVKGAGVGKTMTVRKISNTIGVEKIFPLNLPSLSKIEVVKKARVRRNNISFVRKSKKRMREVKTITLRTA